MLWRYYWRSWAYIELLLDDSVCACIILGLKEVVEALLVPRNTLWTEKFRGGLVCDLVVSMRVNRTIKPEDWGTGGDGAVESGWIFHSEPRGKHTAI